jgi:methionyl-tRNA formyltransferase
MGIGKILLFGDSWGLPQLIKNLPGELVCGIVGAEIRPQYHAELEALADAHQVPYLRQPRKQTEHYLSFIDHVCALTPDLILVNSYSMLLHPEILCIPRFGSINIHSALLPKYRGSNPLQWVIINDEAETGVTMHYMTAQFDAGDIIAQRRVPICFQDTWLDLQTRCAAATDALLREEMVKVLTQTNERRPQAESVASYSRRRRPEDGLIDWRQDVVSIHNLIRALVRPLPGAFYYSSTGQVTLDEYLFVPEIISLKYAAEVGSRKLRSEHVDLVPLALNDVPLALDQFEGLDHSPFEGLSKTADHEEVLGALRRRNDLVIFGVHACETNELIGSCWLENVDYAVHSAWLNIRMNGDAHPQIKELEKEAVALVLSFAFDELNLQRINPPEAVEGAGRD